MNVHHISPQLNSSLAGAPTSEPLPSPSTMDAGLQTLVPPAVHVFPQRARSLSLNQQVQINTNNAGLKSFQDMLSSERSHLAFLASALDRQLVDANELQVRQTQIQVFGMVLDNLHRRIEEGKVFITSAEKNVDFHTLLNQVVSQPYRLEANAEFSISGKLEKIVLKLPRYGMVILNEHSIEVHPLLSSAEGDLSGAVGRNTIASTSETGNITIPAESPFPDMLAQYLSRSPTPMELPPSVLHTAAHNEVTLTGAIEDAIYSLAETLENGPEIVHWIEASVNALKEEFSAKDRDAGTSHPGTLEFVRAIPTATDGKFIRSEIKAHISAEGQVTKLMLQCPLYGTWVFPAVTTINQNVSPQGAATPDEPVPLLEPEKGWKNFIDDIFKAEKTDFPVQSNASRVVDMLAEHGVPLDALHLNQSAPPGMSLRAKQILVKSLVAVKNGSINVVNLTDRDLNTKIRELTDKKNDRLSIPPYLLVILPPAAISHSFIQALRKGIDAEYDNLSKQENAFFRSGASALTYLLVRAAPLLLKTYTDIESINFSVGIGKGAANSFVPNNNFHLYLLNRCAEKTNAPITRARLESALRTIMAGCEKISDPWAQSLFAKKQDWTNAGLMKQLQSLVPTINKESRVHLEAVSFLVKNLEQEQRYYEMLQDLASQVDSSATARTKRKQLTQSPAGVTRSTTRQIQKVEDFVVDFSSESESTESGLHQTKKMRI